MLDGCRAYIVAQTPTQNRSLMRLAERAGFSAVTGLLAEAVPILAGGTQATFFLVHYKLGDEAMRSIIHMIRNAPSSSIRFAPVILISDDCPAETVLKYIGFGFDDIISLPERCEEIASRLVNQLNSDRVYYETRTYLGPDRRRMERPDAPPDKRRNSANPHTRYVIRRSVKHGVHVLRKDLFGLANPLLIEAHLPQLAARGGWNSAMALAE